MNTLKIIARISFLPLFLFVVFNSPIQTQAQIAVPVNDLALNITTAAMLVVEEQTSIAVSAQTIKEVGSVPGINPIAQGAVNPGTAIMLAVTSLDFSANIIAKTIVKKLTDSIVGWIDSGFAGQPAFIGNPEKFLLDVADSVAGDFIEGSALDIVCEPFNLQVRLGLDYKYRSTFEDTTCRLSDALNNIENFADFTGGNFARGGWDGWFQVIQPQNNPYGSYINAEAELGVRIAGRQNIELLQLDWGSGFLSFQKCLEPEGAPLSECLVKGPIETPGTVIESGLNDVLGTEFSELGLADSFDKIIAALLNQLVSKALSSSGLAGISTGGGDGGGDSGDRVFPPLPPTNLTTTATSSTEINVSWSPSVDDFRFDEVGGYYVYRDGEKIGTNDGKNNTFYPDSGLQPSTEYSYRISTFKVKDSEDKNNESSKTNPVATTTFPLP